MTTLFIAFFAGMAAGLFVAVLLYVAGRPTLPPIDYGNGEDAGTPDRDLWIMAQHIRYSRNACPAVRDAAERWFKRLTDLADGSVRA